MTKKITTNEAAIILGLRWTKQVVRLIQKGEIDGERIGRDWQVDAASVEAYKRRMDNLTARGQ
jgi:excisionase family DNA binding protein